MVCPEGEASRLFRIQPPLGLVVWNTPSIYYSYYPIPLTTLLVYVNHPLLHLPI
jgi:hypothetical protein